MSGGRCDVCGGYAPPEPFRELVEATAHARCWRCGRPYRFGLEFEFPPEAPPKPRGWRRDR